MSKLIPGNNKHLTLEDRIYIEESLNEDKSFREISKYLCKDPSTISAEVLKNRIPNTWNRGSFNNPYNFCIHRFRCKKTNVCEKIVICDTYCRSCHKCNSVCKRFERETCRRIEKAPYVCNGCDKPRNRCPVSTKYNYDAKAAQRMYEDRLVSAREGISLTRKQLHELDATVKPLIQQGQSPYMIIASHPELNISVSTLYNYIDQGVLLTRNIDLKRKVKFKPRKAHKTQITNRDVFIGRTYKDFLDSHANEEPFWEMDTVESAKGSGKCILTFYFPDIELFYARLLQRKTANAVKDAFNLIQERMGGEYDFICLFPIILTDRGVEFGDPDSLETSPGGTVRTSIYYCDPMRSNQKAGVENIHTMLRMIIPKGTVFTDLTQWQIRKCVDHINSSPRKTLNGSTPYLEASKRYSKDVINALQLRYVAPDDVVLTPKLLKL
ncbi:MAG: IS30 family transposase [Clostridiales bacterium]|nr:IS30 family transposase [Clostridiales bacterium]